MITIIIQDQQGTELDRFQMIHAAFEDRSKFPESPDLFASFVGAEQLETLGNSPYARMIRAAYFQGRAGGVPSETSGFRLFLTDPETGREGMIHGPDNWANCLRVIGSRDQTWYWLRGSDGKHYRPDGVIVQEKS